MVVVAAVGVVAAVAVLDVRGSNSFELDSRTINGEDFESIVKGRIESFTSDKFDESFVRV